MGRIYQIQQHEPAHDLELEASRTPDGRYKLRLLVMSHILRNPSIGSKRLYEQYRVSKPTMGRWLKHYNQGGMKALKEFNKGGRSEGNPKWDEGIFEALFEQIKKQEEHWSAPKMQAWIKERFAVEIPERTIRNHLKKANLSYKSGRPTPYRGDKEAQEHFKKVV